MTFYLGIDAGTQSLKAQLIEVDSGLVAAKASVNFGQDLPEYQSPHGFIENPDPVVRMADPCMWLDALDMLLRKLQESGAPMGEIAGISGSGQQHGSVYLNAGFAPALARLDAERTLSEQLKPTLSRRLSPIWMDHSTSQECAELTAEFGRRLQDDTGSPAVERFTGPQIHKFAGTEPKAYRETTVIHLVSSFLASVLAGKSMPIDYGDGAGMNLLNLHTLRWDADIVAFTAPGLAEKLPDAVPSHTVCGALSPYFAKYGLKPGTPLAVWSGDNPNSLGGTGAAETGMAVISLGTSDTYFGSMPEFRTDPAGCGHVFGNPAGGFMSLICFSNGSLAREEVKKQCGVGWTFFDRTAGELTPPGNNGKLMLPYFVPENVPPVLKPGVRYNFDPTTAKPEERVRCIFESQAVSMYLHSRWMGVDTRRIRITGGASASPVFRQILADVFQADVESIAVADSAALGAALRAANAVGKLDWATLYEKFCAAIETVKPIPANREIYRKLTEDYRKLEARI